MEAERVMMRLKTAISSLMDIKVSNGIENARPAEDSQSGGSFMAEAGAEDELERALQDLSSLIAGTESPRTKKR